MEGVTNALNIVLSIFVMIGIGMLLPVTKLFKDDISPVLSKLVVKIALPAMIINNIFGKYSRETLIDSAPSLLISFINVGFCLLVGIALCRLFRIDKKRAGAFTCLFTFCNSAFIGVPITQALFGADVVPITLLYYLANTTFFWTLGYAMMCRDGDPNGKAKIRLKKVFSLPVIVLFISAVLVFFRVKLPAFVLSATNYVGSLVTPLSLMYIGLLLYRMIKNRTVRWEKEYLPILIGRFLLCPLLMLLLAKLAGVAELNRNVLLMEACMPCMSQTAIVAGECRSDDEFVAGGVALSTILCLAVIPAYMAVIEFLL